LDFCPVGERRSFWADLAALCSKVFAIVTVEDLAFVMPFTV